MEIAATPPIEGVLAFSSYIGDDAVDRSITVGVLTFPTFAWVTNQSTPARDPYFKTTDMADGSSYGVSAELLNTGRIDILENNGIRIDDDQDVNLNPIVYDVFTAKNTSSGIKVASYIGNGVDNTNITGVGFDPELVIVVQTSASNSAIIRADNFAVDTSVDLKSGGTSTTRIKDLITDGFKIGTSSKVNTNSAIYQYIAFKSFNNVEGKVKIQQYTGDGVAGRAITGVGFLPKFVLVTSDGSNQGVHKSEGMSGNNSKRHIIPTFDTNSIKTLDVDGFTIGDSSSVNALGETYSALCLSD